MKTKTPKYLRTAALNSEALNCFQKLFYALNNCFRNREHKWIGNAAIDNITLASIRELLSQALTLSVTCGEFNWPNSKMRPSSRKRCYDTFQKIWQKITEIENNLRIKKIHKERLRKAVTVWDSSQVISNEDMACYFALLPQPRQPIQKLPTKSICKTRRSRKKT